MVYEIVDQCAQSLGNLQVCLNKAEQYAAAKEFDVDVLLTSRLAPDQHHFIYWAPGKVIEGIDYLLQVTIPNVFFHITTAYAILRHNGVNVGKMDYLGTMKFVDG